MKLRSGAGGQGPKRPRAALALLCVATLTHCSHVVLLKTTPPGATVTVDGVVRGVTPLFFEESTGFGRTYQVTLDLEGHERERLQLQQNVWWHSCLWPSLCLVPFTCGLSGAGILFSRSLDDEYTILLRPRPEASPRQPAASAPASAPREPAASAPASAPRGPSSP